MLRFLLCTVAVSAGLTLPGSSLPSVAAASDYQLQVKTADEAGAGTDANIFVSLYGEFGRSDEVRLNPLIHHDAFERNSTETVQLNGLPQLGTIHQVDVRSDNRYLGSAWRLSWIKIFPTDVAIPSSEVFNDGWIDDTKTRSLTDYNWPWSLTETGVQADPGVVRQMNSINLLDASDSLQQVYKVTYKIEDQVQVATQVHITDELKTELDWKSPKALDSIGSLDAKVTSDWKDELDKKRVNTTTTDLITEDSHTMTFPAGKLTLVETDWRTPWVMSLGTLGSMSIGLRYLSSPPTSSWTIGNYAKGAVVPEPFATFLRTDYPRVASLFSLPDPKRYVTTTRSHNTLANIAAWKLHSKKRWRDLYKWNQIFFVKRQVGAAQASGYRIANGIKVFYAVKKLKK